MSSGVVSEKLLGGSPINGAPQVIPFCLLVWDACHVVGITCNDRRSLRNTFGWMGARPLEAPKNLHLTVKSVELSDLKRPPERLQSQCNYRPFIT